MRPTGSTYQLLFCFQLPRLNPHLYRLNCPLSPAFRAWMFEGFLLKEVPNDTWTLVIENHSIRNSCPFLMNDFNNMIQSHRFSIAGLFFFRGETFFCYGPRWTFQSPPGRDLSLRYRNGSRRQHFVSVLIKLGLRRKRVWIWPGEGDALWQFTGSAP